VEGVEARRDSADCEDMAEGADEKGRGQMDEVGEC